MSRLLPAALTIAPEDMPRAKLDTVRVCNELRRAGVAEDRHEAVVALLQRSMDDYALSRLVEQTGATPGEVRRYMARLRRFVAEAEAMLSPAGGRDSNAARALIQNSYVRGTLPPGAADTLIKALRQFATGISRGFPPSDGGAKAETEAGKVAQARRHRKLARGFLEGWDRLDLPWTFTNNGLLYRLYVIALASVGERQADPSRVFEKAVEEMGEGQEVH